MILLGLAVVGAILAYWVRRWSKQSDLPPVSGFTLHDLRELVKEGLMTEEEFRKASKLVAKSQIAQFLPPAKADPKPEKHE